MSGATPRVLLCVTVYNGRAFVPRCLESAVRLDPGTAHLDILVLDDCSPEPGWSAELADLSAKLGVRYYRSPRNLGIPRNVSLGLLAAQADEYDYVIISNSDVIYPRNLVPQMLKVVVQDAVGSVTAWSNNVSIYSLDNEDPDTFLADQGVVDWLSATLAGRFGAAAMDIPAGISFCVMIPAHVIADVGVMDPVFGRGYCEETDWSLRSLAAGYRIALAPGTFVYHSGRGSSIHAGLVSGDSTSVPENEAILDLRYPLFRGQVDAFASSGIFEQATDDAMREIMRQGGKQFGYSIEVGWLPRQTADESFVRVLVSPDGREGKVELRFRGFIVDLEVPEFEVGQGIREFFDGAQPTQVNLLDRGPVADALQRAAGPLVTKRGNYPSRV